MSQAKPAKFKYRRRLPHVQGDDKALFVTFHTLGAFEIPRDARDLVLRHCLHDHGTQLQMHAVVVMPTHVHLLFTPLRDCEGNQFSMQEILQAIKGASAHSVNKALGRSRPVWQEESFDHVLRSSEDIGGYVE